MNREHVLLAGLASFVAVGSMLLASPEASANPLTCEHRSAKHLDEHGGRAADDSWHVSHGQLPACDGDNGSHHDDPLEGIDTHDHRDHDGGFDWPGRRDKLGPFR